MFDPRTHDLGSPGGCVRSSYQSPPCLGVPLVILSLRPFTGLITWVCQATRPFAVPAWGCAHPPSPHRDRGQAGTSGGVSRLSFATPLPVSTPRLPGLRLALLLLPVAAHLVQERIPLPGRAPLVGGGPGPGALRGGGEVGGQAVGSDGWLIPPKVLWTGLPGPNLHLLVACAILDMERDTLMLSGFGFNEILKVSPSA